MTDYLISRADAIADITTCGDPAITEAIGQRICCNGQMCGCRGATVEDMLAHAIRALPAYEVVVRELEWVDFKDRGAKARAWNAANYMIQKWSDGRYEISASYPGYSNSIAGIDRYYPSVEAAKAAAQADYVARIRSALTATPAADVAGLVAASKSLIGIVEGISGAMDHGTWRDDHGHRFKDTPEWVAFYVALARMKEAKA